METMLGTSVALLVWTWRTMLEMVGSIPARLHGFSTFLAMEYTMEYIVKLSINNCGTAKKLKV